MVYIEYSKIVVGTKKNPGQNPPKIQNFFHGRILSSTFAL